MTERTQPPNMQKEVTSQPKKLIAFNSYDLTDASNMKNRVKN